MAMVMRPGLLYRALVADDNLSNSIIPSFPKIPSSLVFVAALVTLFFGCNNGFLSSIFCVVVAAVPVVVVTLLVWSGLVAADNLSSPLAIISKNLFFDVKFLPSLVRAASNGFVFNGVEEQRRIGEKGPV
jgi:hypothetical protein